MSTSSTRARASNVSTIVTQAAHGLNLGNKITITGMTDVSFNGTWVVASVPTTTSFTFANTGPDVSSGSDTGATITEQVVTSVAVNPVRMYKTLLTTTTGTLGPYRYRGGATAPLTLGISVGDIGADGTWTVALKTVAPGGAIGDAYTVESYTTLITKVFDPGGDIDVYLDCTAHGGSSTLQLMLSAGPH